MQQSLKIPNGGAEQTSLKPLRRKHLQAAVRQSKLKTTAQKKKTSAVLE